MKEIVMQAKKGKDGPDTLAGMLFIALGTLGLYAGRDLEMGTLSMMDSGYLPKIICSLILVLGLIILAKSFFGEKRPVDDVMLRPIAVIMLAIGGFALAAESLGFVIACLWLVGVGSFADRSWRFKEILLLSAGLTAFSMAVFIFGLGVQIDLWP
jgi:hypothetical protein